jgi:hypothetical protein
MLNSVLATAAVRSMFRCISGASLAAGLLLGPAAGNGLAAGSILESGAAGSLPGLRTNQKFIEEIARAPAFDIQDQKAVFQFIFHSLPNEVRVYPTENYYYFTFYHGGVKYAGNLRLAAVDRDQGVLHFAYFADANMSSQEGEMYYKQLTSGDGVTVEKAGPLEYMVAFGGKQIAFRLNDLSDVAPREGLLRDTETYIGPVFDESGVQFFLVYNTQFKIFHYILNETWGQPDQFIESEVAERIVIGKRTGFAFYMDHHIDRKILIAVHAANVTVNNYYDGPFDQLPDNFIEGDTLKNAIEESDPSMTGQIDRYGYLKSGEGRYLIGPYLQYSEPGELVMFDTCANSPDFRTEQYPRCFAVQGGGR